MALYNTRNKSYFNNDSELWLKSTSLEGRPGAGGIGTKTNSAPNFSWVGVGAELGNNFAFEVEVNLSLNYTFTGGWVSGWIK